MVGDHETTVFILRVADALFAAEMKKETDLAELLAGKHPEAGA